MTAQLRFPFLFTLLVFFGIMALTSCKDDEIAVVPGLTGSWILSHMEETSDDGIVTSIPVNCADIVFTDEEELPSSGQTSGIKMNGWLPVNSYMGHYQASQASMAIQQGKMNFVNLINTEINGNDSDMEFEAYYMQALQNVKRFEVKSDQLILWNAEGNVKVVYVRGASSCGR